MYTFRYGGTTITRHEPFSKEDRRLLRERLEVTDEIVARALVEMWRRERAEETERHG